MNKKIHPLIYIFGGAAVIGGAYYSYKKYQESQDVDHAPTKVVFGDKGSKPIKIVKEPRELDLAVREQNIEKAKELLEDGANPNLFTDVSGPALNEASDWVADVEMMRLLISFKADPKQANAQGVTPLHKVITTFNPHRAEEAFTYLLKEGADPEAQDKEGNSVRDYIKTHQKGNLQKILNDFDNKSGVFKVKPAQNKNAPKP
jgi:ankyrin repeat protein